jgi:hypothetical protein
MFMKVRFRKSRPFCSLCKVLPWALRLATFVPCKWHKEEVCGDRLTMDIGWPTE